MNFKIQHYISKTEKLIDKLDIYFVDFLHKDIPLRTAIIKKHLSLIKNGLEERYKQWNELPLLWAALGSKKQGKHIAQQLYDQIKESKSHVISSFEWNWLQNFVNDSKTLIELKSFIDTDLKFSKCNALFKFHCQYFSFCSNNVSCERVNAVIYRNKHCFSSKTF